MKLTIIESPYAFDPPVATAYARRCMSDAIKRGECPFASHLLYTQPGILDDTIETERQLGMSLGFEFYRYATKCAVYTDYGISSGMLLGIAIANNFNISVDYREIKTNLS